MDNITAKILRYTGWGIIILGIAGSIYIGKNIITFLAGFLSCYLLGLIFIGLGEIISILDDSRKNQVAISKKLDGCFEELKQFETDNNQEEEELPYI